MSIASWMSPFVSSSDLAHLARHLARDLFLVALEDVADAIEVLGALRRRREAPRLVRAFARHRPRHSDVVGVRLLKRADEIVADWPDCGSRTSCPTRDSTHSPLM